MRKIFRKLLKLTRPDWSKLPVEKRLFVSTNAIKRIL